MKNLRTTDSPALASFVERGGHQTPCALDTRAEREFSQLPSQAKRSKTTTGKSSKAVTFIASLSKGASETLQLCSAATAFSLARNSVSDEIARTRIECSR